MAGTPEPVVDLPAVLTHLAGVRPVFHSEADFQHALAWTIHESVPGADVRLEVPIAAVTSRARVNARQHIDLIVTLPRQRTVAIELKYVTAQHQETIGRESFNLSEQSAHDHRRYDFWLDVERLERFGAAHGDGVFGYAILLTNARALWDPPRNARWKTSIDSAFRVHQGHVVGPGKLAWGGVRRNGMGVSQGTTAGRETDVDVRGRHTLTWRDYSHLPADVVEKGSARFRYLVVAV